jgi:hypothetical protein
MQSDVLSRRSFLTLIGSIVLATITPSSNPASAQPISVPEPPTGTERRVDRRITRTERRQERRIRRAERRRTRREGRQERRAIRREGREIRRDIRQGM